MFAALHTCPECGTALGEPHIHPGSFHQRYEAAARGPLLEWLAGLPAEYERLKARAKSDPAAQHGFE